MFAASRAVILLTFLILCGCSGGGSGPAPVEIKGTVTLDGAAMKTGRIVFETGDGGVPTSLDVVDGAFAGKTTPGKKIVRISSFKKVAGKGSGPGGGEETTENVVPARYNSESKETADIGADGAKDLQYKVFSK